MQSDQDPFWSALRRSVEQAEAAAAAEQAAAEQLLRGVDAAAAERLDDARIDAIVAAAVAPVTTAAGADAATAAPAPAAAPAAVPAPPRHFLAAAIALLLTPQFLAAATVATAAVAATALLLQRTTQTLSFQRAVQVLMAAQEPADSRNAAQGAVCGDLLDGIDAVRVAAEDPGELGARARSLLGRLHALLVEPEPFRLRPLPGVPGQLGDQVMDRGLPTATRLRALGPLADLLVYGVCALKAIERAPVPPRLAANNRVLLSELARALP